MWGILSAVALSLGTVLAWKGYTNRDNQTEPAGVAEGTPVRDWPKSISPAESTDHQFARHWQASLAMGVALLLVGLVGTLVDSYRLYANPSPSRDDIFETISRDPTNTMDRDEAECMFDFMDAAGVDITSSNEEQVFSDLVAATESMSDAEIDEFNSCFDAETLSRSDGAVSRMSDEQLRIVFIELAVTDPLDPLDRSTAECAADVIEKRGVMRAFMTSEMQFTARVESALLEAETVCL